MLEYIKIFFIGVLLDFMWALYTNIVVSKKIFLSIIVSMMIGLIGVLGIVGIINNINLVIPYILGLGCGTYLGIVVHNLLERRKQK